MSDKISNDPFASVNNYDQDNRGVNSSELEKSQSINDTSSEISKDDRVTKPKGAVCEDRLPIEPSQKKKVKRKIDRKQFFLKQSYRSQYMLLLMALIGFGMYSMPNTIISLLFDKSELAKAPEFLQGNVLNIAVGWVGVIVLFFSLGKVLIERILYKYEIKEKIIRTHKGIVAKKRSTVQFRHVNSVEVNKSVIGTLMNFGDVELYTASTDGSEILLKGIYNPDEVAKVLSKRLDLDS